MYLKGARREYFKYPEGAKRKKRDRRKERKGREGEGKEGRKEDVIKRRKEGRRYFY